MHKARWSYALVSGLTIGVTVAVSAVVGWVVVGWGVGDPTLDGIGILPAALGGVFFAMTAVGCRARTLSVRPEGPVVERDGVRITLFWTDFERVREESAGRAYLDFKPGLLQPANAERGFRRGVEARLRKAGADRKVAVHQFFPDWRRSELGPAVARAEARNSR